MAVKCVHPGCKVIVREVGKARCELHQKVQNKTQAESRKKNRRNSKIYDTQRWKRISIKKRTIDPFCQGECEAKGILKEAQVVDHIIEIEDGGSPYSMANLQSLCRSCHNTKTHKVAMARKSRQQKPSNKDGDVYV